MSEFETIMRMASQLSLTARPRSLGQLIGQGKMVARLRGHWDKGRVIKAYLLGGPFGTGKTTTARILALAYQCTHQEKFGSPCKECYAKRSVFPIYETNSSDATGIDDMRALMTGADYGVLGEGRYRVYILDEVQRVSEAAQNLLLKYLEDSPETTIFILRSTKPEKIIPALRSRCMYYELRNLTPDDVEKLVGRLLKFAGSTLPADRLAEALNAKYVASPRLIAQACEKYIAGADPTDAAVVEGATELDTEAFYKAMIRGDWSALSELLLTAQSVDLRPLRMGLIAALRKILLQSSEVSDSTAVVADSIVQMCELSNAEDLVIYSYMSAALYRVCALFSKYKH